MPFQFALEQDLGSWGVLTIQWVWQLWKRMQVGEKTQRQLIVNKSPQQLEDQDQGQLKPPQHLDFLALTWFASVSPGEFSSFTRQWHIPQLAALIQAIKSFDSSLVIWLASWTSGKCPCSSSSLECLPSTHSNDAQRRSFGRNEFIASLCHGLSLCLPTESTVLRFLLLTLLETRPFPSSL